MKVFVDGSPTRVCYVAEGERPEVRDLGDKFTNNQAEYLAILVALKNLENVTEILTDSELAVKQLDGRDVVANHHLKLLAQAVWERVDAKFVPTKKGLRCVAPGRVVFTWIPREENLAGRVLG